MSKILILFFLLVNFISAATLYVGSGETYTTIGDGIFAMSAGDTLIIRSGTYTGAINTIDDFPSGNSWADRTTIMAEVDWGVTIDMNQAANSIGLNADNGQDYWEVRGINFTDTDLTVVSVTANGADPSSYFYIRFCSASETSDGNHYGFGINDGRHGLIEDCFTFGRMRYAFGASGSSTPSPPYEPDSLIFRRCVARLDYFNEPSAEEPNGAFVCYRKADVFFQNCISIDGLEARNYGGPSSYTNHFFGAQGLERTEWTGCMVINSQGGMAFWESSGSTNNLIDNCLFIGNDGDPFNNGLIGANATSNGGVIRRSSFFYNYFNQGFDAASVGGFTINANISYGDTLGTGYYVSDLASDSLLANTSWGSYGSGLLNGYANTNSTNNLSTPVPTASYTYATYPDEGSSLAGAGLGCDIRYQHGLTGTYHGQTEWNTEQVTPLFPLAFEDSMRAIMGRGTPIASGNFDPLRGWAGTELSLGAWINGWGAFADDWVPIGAPEVPLDSTVSFINAASYAYPSDIVFSGNKALATFASGVKLISVVNDSTFTELDKYFTGEHCIGAAVQADTGYFVTDSFTYMVDISGNTIVILDSIPILNGQDVEVKNQDLWILTTTNLYRRSAIDLSAGTSVARGGYSLTIITGGPADTLVVSRLSNGLDFTHPTTLAQIRNVPSIDIESQVRASVVAGKDIIYIDGLRIYKYNYVADAVSDSLVFPTNPTRWITINTTADTIYPVLRTDGQLVVDVATLTNLGEVATDYYEYYRGSYRNGYNYIGAFTQVVMGFHAYNVKKAVPTLAGSFEANDYVRGVFAIGNRVFGGEGHYGGSLYDNTYSDFNFVARTRHNSFWNVKANAFWSVGGDVDGTTYLMTPTLTDLDNDAFAGYDFVFVGDSTFISVSQTDGIARYTINDGTLTQTHIETAISAPRQIWANSTLDTVWFADGAKVYAALSSTLALVDSVPSSCLYMTGNDNHIFGSKSATGDEIVRYTHSLSRVDSVASTESRAMFADNNYLYVAREENGMSIYNVDDLTILKTVPSSQDVINVYALDGLVYIAGSSSLMWYNHHGTTPAAYIVPIIIDVRSGRFIGGGSGIMKSGGNGKIN